MKILCIQNLPESDQVLGRARQTINHACLSHLLPHNACMDVSYGSRTKFERCSQQFLSIVLHVSTIQPQLRQSVKQIGESPFDSRFLLPPLIRGSHFRVVLILHWAISSAIIRQAHRLLILDSSNESMLASQVTFQHHVTCTEGGAFGRAVLHPNVRHAPLFSPLCCQLVVALMFLHVTSDISRPFLCSLPFKSPRCVSKECNLRVRRQETRVSKIGEFIEKSEGRSQYNWKNERIFKAK